MKAFFNIKVAMFLIIIFTSLSVLYSQDDVLPDYVLLQYMPDNVTGYERVENATFVIPMPYGKLAVSWYTPINSNDNTTNNNIATTQTRLVILNLNALGNDNTTGLGYEQVIGPSGNLCDAAYDNVSIDNFTGTLLTNNCQEGVFFSLYIPLFASEDYLLALYADGPNVNDINNLVNSVDLEGLSNEINNL